MRALIAAAFSRSRSVTLVLLLVLAMGTIAYQDIPKEAEPDVNIPVIYVSMAYEGISPEDAERLLVRPMERELSSIEGLDEIKGTATEGFASVTLEFDAGFDADRALDDVREGVDIAKSELPQGAEEPRVSEVNVALFPVLTVGLSGPVPERALIDVAEDLQDRIEALPGVLEADIGGNREEQLEVAVDDRVMQTYDVSYADLFNLVDRNNRLIAAGALDTGAGRLSVKVPGVIENMDDVLGLPVKVDGDRVVTFSDVATVRRTFKDPNEFARINGQPAVTLEVSKRLGANIIEVNDQIRSIVAEVGAEWPSSLEVTYLQDRSEDIRTMLRDLQNNVVTAVVLVMIVVVAVMGWRPALLVGLAIPGAFLTGILAVHAMGYTMNIVVLFSLILVVGMLVDAAIVVVELAERRMTEGWSPTEAYRYGAQRMSWPITAATVTTLAVFVPLLFWSGLVGQFMKYLPITVLVTLAASLVMALIFIPVLGGWFARPGGHQGAHFERIRIAESGDLTTLTGFSGAYARFLGGALQRPGSVALFMLAAVISTYIAYGRFGAGVEFFPSTEPDYARVQVQARGDLSIYEKDELVRAVEERLADFDEVEFAYTRVFADPTRTGGQSLARDAIGIVQLDFVDWTRRRPAEAIVGDIRGALGDIPGIRVQITQQQQGPGQAKPIELQLSGLSDQLDAGVERVRERMRELGGFADVQDNRPLPGIDWSLQVDRERAARYNADVQLVGNAVQLVTNGVLIADYRPDDADDELDIRVRFPVEQRSLDHLGQLRVPTQYGQVPVSNFVDFVPTPKVGTLERIDSQRVLTISADVESGRLVDERVQALRASLQSEPPPEGVQVSFKGEDEDQREAQAFLSQAFVVSIALMGIILVTQFNSLYQTTLVLSAIVLSSAGVLLGLMITQRPFSIVMGGVGMIALAGIVVNNNIVLIDTYNALRAEGMAVREAIIRTAAQRLRPVLLTSVTTVLGLMPMVLKLNVDLLGRNLEFNAPSTQWWAQLSATIAGGLTFATVLTLVLTPCLLMLGHNASEAVGRWRNR
ncbi:acriflavin resistance protein [Spiribacter salinus M19-40]|jgi:multidrug efflux pump|uniref:Acriflavin resistance protein n=1 Tax=Spiribacter salinus M19-40 TaxID=1260251 RepID=R4VQG7_9GAMM|nr:efflux RND transporter permease subunit [Spiribacter salinus]AGM41688.1 acriflavin resistance protein [Spiribacter salinus M19-40]MBY5268761.1 acriflavin resistance protein [Spiribacter salinus]